MLRANLSQGYTYPTLSQLFLSTTAGGQLTVGNPDLRPETSITAEIGGRWDAGGLVLDATAFYSSAEDFIDRQSVATPPGAPPSATYLNIDSATTFGAELYAESAIGDTGLTPYLSGALIRRELDFGGGAGTTIDSGVPLLNGRVGLRYDWSWGENLLGTLDAFVQGETDAEERTRDGTLFRAAGYTTLNLRADVSIGEHARIGAEFNNILDAEFDPLDEVPGAGRGVSLFATINF